MTRAELYAMVWETPTSRLAGRFGVSNAELRKICSDHNVPLPTAGYWTKVAHGKPVDRPLLPASLPDAVDYINLVASDLGQASLDVTDAQISDYDLSFAPSPEVSSQPNGQVTEHLGAEYLGAEHLGAEHLGAEHLGSALRACKPDEMGFVSVSDPALPFVRVGVRSIDRVIRLFDQFVTACVQAGGDISTADGKLTFGFARGIFQIRILETRRKVMPPRLRGWAAVVSGAALGNRQGAGWIFAPSGKLCLDVVDPRPSRRGHRSSVGLWRDRKGRDLEASIPLAVAAMTSAPRRIRRARERLEFVETEHATLVLETARRERDRRDFLINKSESFARYMRLRSFAEYLASRDYHLRSAPVDAMVRALLDLCAELESEFSDSHLGDEIAASTLFEVDDKQ